MRDPSAHLHGHLDPSEEALAVALANLKGTKDKDVVATATALQALKKVHKTDSAVAKQVGVSREIVREFIAILGLPENVQRMIQTHRMGLERSRRLRELLNVRPADIERATELLAEMTAHDGRHFVQYAIQHPELSVDEAAARVIQSKTVRKIEHHVIAILDEVHFAKLRRLAKVRRVSINDLVTGIVVGYLGEKS